MLPVTEIIEAATGMKGNQETMVFAARVMSDQPPVVVWNITNTCNMSCPHCYSGATTSKHERGLNFDQLKQIAMRLREYGIRIVVLSGGEPLMRPDLEQLVAFLKSQNMIVHLSSNGVLMDLNRAMALKSAGVGYTGISIDGLPAFNDGYRGFGDAFNHAFAGIDAVHLSGMKSGLRITMHRDNIGDIGELLALAAEHRVDRFYISHLLYSGRATDMQQHDLDRSTRAATVHAIFRLAQQQLEGGARLKIVTGGNDVDGVFLHRFIGEHYGEHAAAIALDYLKRRGGNRAGEKIINIDVNGNVHPDQFWQSSNSGNILESDLESILQREPYRFLREREKFLESPCRQCESLAICRGSHRERALYVFNDLNLTDPSCYRDQIDREIKQVKPMQTGATA